MAHIAFYRRQIRGRFDVINQYIDRRLAATEEAGGSSADRLRNPRFWTFAVIVTALAVLILFWSPNYFVGVAAAIALPIVMARHSATLVVFMALIAQEEIPGPRIGFATILGDRAYYTGKVPLVLIVAVTASLVAVARLWSTRGREISVAAKILFGIVACLVVLSIVDGFIAGQSLLSAINQNARPFIACGVGILIGLSLRPPEVRMLGVINVDHALIV